MPGLLGLVLLLGGGMALAQYEAHIHFLVVPQTAAPGMKYAEAMDSFQAALVKLAGGYTELGFGSGAAQAKKKIHRMQNVSFMVYAPRDVTVDLVKLIKKYFAAKHPFVLHWKGSATLPPGR